MKKTLAIILSVVMLLGVLPFGAFAADYDRAKIAANDTTTVEALTEEQIASVILDWVDRQIAEYAEDIKASVTESVAANLGFDGFESYISAELDEKFDVKCLDDIIGYKGYLAELGGDFTNLKTESLITREAAGTDLDFIYGVIQFMADNSETFGKVFRWDDEVFDYGKVGEYIETLKGTDDQEIYDFYINYLVGNDIQSNFISWVSGQMKEYYTPAEGESFDDTLNNGIMAWFSGLCADNGILSEEGLATLRDYDLRTTDIYTLIQSFVGLVQSDNQVKIDTYYNYIMDTVVRTLLKTTIGQTATVGAAAEVPANFTATYADLGLLYDISGGTAYYKDGDSYYQITITKTDAGTDVEGNAVYNYSAAANTLTWSDALDINFETPVATIYTGAEGTEKVAEYRPSSTNYLSADTMPVYMYASAQNQATINAYVTGGDTTKTGLKFAGTEVASTYADIIANEESTALKNRFIFKVEGKDLNGNALNIPAVDLDFAAIEAYAEAQAVAKAQEAVSAYGITVESVDISLTYTGWETKDTFIAQVTVGDDISAIMSNVPVVGNLTVTKDTKIEMLGTSIDVGTMMTNAVNSVITNPLITIVADELGGSLNVDKAKGLLDFIDTDFAITPELLDFAGNYTAYDGVVGQVNHILYGLVDMLVSDSGMDTLALVDGDNTNLDANLEKICSTANDMMAAANEVINNEEYKNLANQVGIDVDALLSSFDTELLYKIDFSSVEALWVSVINLGLDMVDDGTNETLTAIHTAVNDLENLDAMAVAMADYVLGKCIPSLNDALETKEINFALTVPAKTDATAVADGAGKDIIMTKLVDVLYEAATNGVALVNEIANEALATIATDTGIEMPTIAFQLGVTKGADWQTTLAALVNRVYQLADGIIIACDNTYTDTIDKISAVANAILPLGSLASNCASDDGKLALDGNKVMGYMFDNGLEGNFGSFLGLFETKVKTEDVAADCSVTEALINASQHIVDSIFPGTVVASNYVNATSDKFTETTVQEYFTSAENDAVIASNNMDSINTRKADLIPAALRLAREAGILPFFAKCDKDHTAEDLDTTLISGTEATCTEAGREDAYACADCGFVVSGGAEIPATGHSFGEWKTTSDPTCTKTGVSTRTCDCGVSETNTIPATGHTFGEWTVTRVADCEQEGIQERKCACGHTETQSLGTTDHTDEDSDNTCDVCGDEIDSSFIAKLKAFFQKIVNWFKNLFS
ncbi:MAG: hypothetical protein IJ491_00620 [Clostridia bacterium]|nr:hypothetical protein [Clostridia bacterium]